MKYSVVQDKERGTSFLVYESKTIGVADPAHTAMYEEINQLRQQCAALADVIAAAGDENARLRQGIQDILEGNYPSAKKYEQCKHNRYGYEGCEQCIDDALQALLGVEGE